MTTATITKATRSGQITLPKKWREQFKTDQYVLRAGDFKLEIAPVDEEELEWINGETIFNADRDNNGKPIEAREFLRILRSVKKNGQNTKTSGKNSGKGQGEN